MNYWEESPEWWKKKTQSPIYEAQKKEIVIDLLTLAELQNLPEHPSVLDVAGYDGTLGKYLPKHWSYESIDILTGQDITGEWKDFPQKEKYDIAVLSLTLLCFSPENQERIMQRIDARAKIVYIMDEEPVGRKAGEKINDDYGGKWAVTLTELIKGRTPYKNIKQERARTNPRWLKYTLIK